MKENDKAIVVDHTTETHRGTGIMMLRVRPWHYGEKSARTQLIAEHFVVDFDAEGQIIQIELLAPERYFPKEIIDLLPPEFIETEEPILCVECGKPEMSTAHDPQYASHSFRAAK